MWKRFCKPWATCCCSLKDQDSKHQQDGMKTKLFSCTLPYLSVFGPRILTYVVKFMSSGSGDHWAGVLCGH